jgi:hypothetical protein
MFICNNLMRLWVFKRHFSTIFQLYIDLWATLPGANMVQGRNTLWYLRTRTFYIINEFQMENNHRMICYIFTSFFFSNWYSTLQVYQRSYSQVGHIPPKMSDKFESTLSKSVYLVGHRGRTSWREYGAR